MPDPTVDADGNLTMRGSRGDDEQGATADSFDADAFAAAQEVCGDIPAGALGFDTSDESEIEDALLEFAQCMRDEGIEMDDPDLSAGLVPGAGGSIFGDLDMDAPDVKAAMETCQSTFAGFGSGGDDTDSSTDGGDE